MGESWQQRRACALGLLADPVTVTSLLRAVGCASSPDRPAEPERHLRPTTVYLHVRADGTFDVEGHGTVCAGTVRELVSTSAVSVRPVIDLNAEYTSMGYQPSDTVAEAVVLTSERCVFPYCDQPARRCQLDHTIPWPHGSTGTSNLGPLCLHHHHVKTHGGWTVHRVTHGTYAWRSPRSGDAYVVNQEGTVRL